METQDNTHAEHSRIRWRFLPLWVLALSAVGALSYRIAAEAPLAGLTFAPAAFVLFGTLAGIVQWSAQQRQGPPVRWWILASSLAGLLAGSVGLLMLVMGAVATQSSAGVLAGWACAWATYGAAFGVALQRTSPGRSIWLASLAGWATAGIVGGLVGWTRDMFLVRPNTFVPFPSISLTRSMEDIILVGAVYGATGGAITEAARFWLLRRPILPPDQAASRAKDTRLVIVAGVITGLIAAVLCTFLTPLILWVFAGPALDLAGLADGFDAIRSDAPVCIPVLAMPAIPLGIGCGYAGLVTGRARGRPDLRPWIWCGAAVGGFAAYVLGSLLIVTVVGL